MKQTERLKDIFKERGDDITFEPVDRTLHEGFVDHALRVCVFTDHQIFDRFHKYNLRSDKARSGNVALSLKELNMFEPGDYVVHIDHGIGRFAGLVRIRTETLRKKSSNWYTRMRMWCLCPFIHYIKSPSTKEKKENSPVSVSWAQEPGKKSRNGRRLKSRILPVI